MGFQDAIRFYANATPNNAAMALTDRVVTYSMVVRAVDGMAFRLIQKGLQKNDVVSVHISNPIRHMVTMFALHRAGLIAAPGAPMKVSEESENPHVVAILSDVLLQESSAPVILVNDDWFAPSSSEYKFEATPFGIDDIFRYSYSSGSTGLPKAVGMTQRISDDRTFQRVSMIAGLSSCDRVLCLPGVSGNWGFRLALQVLGSGGLIAFAASALESLQMIELFGIRYVAASTHQLREMIAVLTREPRSMETLRLIETGGSIVGENLMADAESAFACRILSNYSATESGVIAFGLRQHLRGRSNAVGYVAPWAQVSIVSEDGRELAQGEEGIVRVRTSSIASGLGSSGEWFETGDCGVLERNGLLVLTGRASHVINAGGTKISPETVEDGLIARGDIADAALISMVSGGHTGETWLAVQAKGRIDPLAVINWCQERGWPVDAIRLVDAIPRSATGKIMRDQVALLLRAQENKTNQKR